MSDPLPPGEDPGSRGRKLDPRLLEILVCPLTNSCAASS